MRTATATIAALSMLALSSPANTAVAQDAVPASLAQWPCAWLHRWVNDGAQPRFFGDTSDMEQATPPHWIEFQTADALEAEPNPYSSAVAWTHSYGTLVNMTFSSPSGDWVQFAFYCFRADGSLAHLETDYRTFYADPNPVRRIRRTAFRRNGKVAQADERTIDMETHRVLKQAQFMDREDDIFTNIRKLPFWRLLKRERTPSLPK